MGKYKRLGKNTLLVFAGNIGSRLIGLLMLPLYTRWLSVEDYGASDIINVYVSLLTGIVTCSIFSAIFIFPKDVDKDKQSSYFSSGLVFSLSALILTGLILFVVDIICYRYSISNSFVDYIWLIYGLLVAMNLQNYMQQFTRSIDKMKVYSIAGIILTISTAAASFIFIPEYGVKGYVVAMILANAVTALYSFLFSSAYMYLSLFKLCWADCKEMLLYSIPLIPNGITWWLVSALNRPIMESEVGLHGIGLYAVANKLPSILTVLYTVFSFSWQISVIEEFKKPGFKKFYNQVFKTFVILFLALSIGFALSSKLIVSFIADAKFYDSWKYIPILTIAVFFSSISGFVGTNFSATRESKYFFYSSIWGAVASVLMNFMLIPIWGVWGAAISVVISQVVAALSRIKYSWKHVKIENIPLLSTLLFLNIAVIIGMLTMENQAMYILFMSVIVLLFLFLIRKDLFSIKQLVLKLSK